MNAEPIMPMSEYEQRQWHELEAQLAQERRLVRLERRLGTASAGAGTPRKTSLLWGAGGGIGLILVVAGAVVHSTVVGTAGVVILAGTLVLAGVALIAVGLSGYHREHRSAHGRQPRSPSL